MLHIGVNELDDSPLDSLFGLLGYIARIDAGEETDTMTFGGRKYRRVSADEIHF